MKPNVLPYMPLKPLVRISPSRFISMQKCTLRELWAANREVPALLPSSPVAKIGTVIHKMIELAGYGLINDEQLMESHWKKEIYKIEQDMKKSWLEKHLTPLSKYTRNYEVKRQLCFLMIQNLTKHKSQQEPIQGISSTHEFWVESKDKKVGGKIDLIYHGSDGVQIVDYKTGAVLESNYGGGLVKLDYQLQIKLYAALFHSTYDSWPDKLTIMGLDQKTYDIPFATDECKILLQKAKTFLDNINKRIVKGALSEELAEPSPESCKYCIFRPGCIKYWSKRQETMDWPEDCCGIVQEKVALGNGLIRLILKNGQKNIIIRGLSPIRNKYLLEDAKEVLFCNLIKDTTPDYYYEGPLTTGYIVKDFN